ncbi:uncharacterized protein LOC122014458 [Zingiber officinale]|uniref:uncharacterized protein LOC122014458 n=1 Tax=Zingiber officinale TaxID=94328 RepID=UPI001C4CF055|nr:uncharacterized protein LOC122014458 [Zingiber officinale]
MGLVAAYRSAIRRCRFVLRHGPISSSSSSSFPTRTASGGGCMLTDQREEEEAEEETEEVASALLSLRCTRSSAAARSAAVKRSPRIRVRTAAGGGGSGSWNPPGGLRSMNKVSEAKFSKLCYSQSLRPRNILTENLTVLAI